MTKASTAKETVIQNDGASIKHLSK